MLYILREFIGFLIAPIACAFCLILYFTIPIENPMSTKGILEFIRFVGVAILYAYFFSFIPAIIMITVTQFIKNITRYEYYIIGTIIGFIYLFILSITVFDLEFFSIKMLRLIFLGAVMGFVWAFTFSLITLNKLMIKKNNHSHS